MIHKPPIDELAEKTGSKYALCVVASKRARQLIDICKTQNSTAVLNNAKPLTAAAREINEDKVTVTNG